MEMEVYNKGTGIDFILDMVLPMIPDLVKNLENQSFRSLSPRSRWMAFCPACHLEQLSVLVI